MMPAGRVSISAVLVAACLAVAGCNLVSTIETPTSPADAEVAAPFVAVAGEAAVPASPSSDVPFGVVKLDTIPNQSPVAVRLFGVGGGDPAMNGLKTYLGFVSAHDASGFFLGDFYDYRVIGASPGRIDLEIDEHVMDDAGAIAQRTRRVIVSWTEISDQGPDFEGPSTVTMTPAQ